MLFALTRSIPRWVQSKYPSHSGPKRVWVRLSVFVVVITSSAPGVARDVTLPRTAKGSRKCSNTDEKIRVENGLLFLTSAGSSSFSTSQTHARLGPRRLQACSTAH